MLHATLLQHGEHHVSVSSRDMDVHIDVNCHQLNTFGPPEINLQMAPHTKT